MLGAVTANRDGCDLSKANDVILLSTRVELIDSLRNSYRRLLRQADYQSPGLQRIDFFKVDQCTVNPMYN